ncbi:hypothetical protein P167DRAFT_542843 [Morchella conica CCBAS932]|uniref:Uncharacterized protein n=1 Tax=Morchella conica CCBAS932 TaxID=1392247 RepID=A0A3N4KYS6_9PEZI|nr:hypothetical protein P167DRAFT_542843 [Morchella conica CCBAS932]
MAYDAKYCGPKYLWLIQKQISRTVKISSTNKAQYFGMSRVLKLNPQNNQHEQVFISALQHLSTRLWDIPALGWIPIGFRLPADLKSFRRRFSEKEKARRDLELKNSLMEGNFHDQVHWIMVYIYVAVLEFNHKILIDNKSLPLFCQDDFTVVHGVLADTR